MHKFVHRLFERDVLGAKCQVELVQFHMSDSEGQANRVHYLDYGIISSAAMQQDGQK